MSGLYIPGMKKPASCDACLIPMTWCMNHQNKDYPHCPLIEIPAHGRLIEEDGLLQSMLKALFDLEDKAEQKLGFDEKLRRGMQHYHAACVDAVLAAPTVIPAEGETE